MSLVPLAAAAERERFGGKAAQLSRALTAGLPVPDGYALSWEDAAAGRGLDELPDGDWAVRSSAVDEDGAKASFAGQHRTLLHVERGRVSAAVEAVVASGADPGATAYRARMGASTTARVAVVVQRMVVPEVAGVLFSKHPVTGADEVWIEASWGLGEAVVQGLVVPDQWRLARDGRLLAERVGDKDLALVRSPDGGTVEQPVETTRARTPCLRSAELQALLALLARLDTVFEGHHDVEFAFDGRGRLALLQRRGVTR